ncbi:preprotein translocase subunit SecG [Campylobacter sp. Cr9]|uniref:preprotein translocase subunit SecG n=1 Tax=Campylobacter sp. Cr9 TaxID=2735728 RepID=UPI0030A0AF8B|nr:preprotein translocase subunit SecG [Campylobacter sp. Cr9]ULO02243.1 preprotein translocase SecYEG, SecG subunit [Campylobacter sp. RM5004]
MNTIFIAIQFILVVIICACVLMQKSSSIGLGAYSGSNESLFGAKGPAGFLAKFTFIMGVLLVANTIFLSYSYNTKTSESLVNKLENASKQIQETKPQALPESIK